MTPQDPAAAQRAVRRVLWWTLWLNLGVSGSKVAVGRLSGSASMEADGYHSLLDGSNNVVGLVVTALAWAPPDPDHPYGHRKFENAAALLIGLGLLGLAFRVAQEALASVRGPGPEVSWLNWVVMGATLAVNLWVSAYEAREGRRWGSSYLLADAAHTRSDVYVTLGVGASFVAAYLGFGWVDAVVALAIAAFIAVMAGRIVLDAFHTLTDRAVLEAGPLAATVLGVPGVRACREVRTRGGTDAVYVDLVVHVDGGLTLHAAHRLADQIEAALEAAHPQIVDVVVHLEPAEEPASQDPGLNPRGQGQEGRQSL